MIVTKTRRIFKWTILDFIKKKISFSTFLCQKKTWLPPPPPPRKTFGDRNTDGSSSEFRLNLTNIANLFLYYREFLNKQYRDNLSITQQ